MRSDATSVLQYLKELPADRQEPVAAARDLVLSNLPEGFVEDVGWGMINYVVPLERYPDTYNKKPLMFAALGSQKNYISLYMMGLYVDGDSGRDAEFRARWNGGKKLNMGKSCIRFTAFSDLDADLIAQTIRSWTLESFIEMFESVRPNKS